MEVIGRSSRKPEPQWCSQAHLYVGLHYTYTCAYLHKGLHLRFQMLVTKRLRLNTGLSQWKNCVLTSLHLKGPQLPIVGPGQCQMVQQRQSGAVEELHYMNHGRASGHWVEPHPPLSGDCQEWQWTESDACSMGNDLGYFFCLGVFGSAPVQKGTHPTLSGKEVLSGITKPRRQCWLAQGSDLTFFYHFSFSQRQENTF